MLGSFEEQKDTDVTGVQWVKKVVREEAWEVGRGHL